MDDDTTLIVIGDHGMTITGDHGGDSADETTALLFAHIKSKTFITDDYGFDNETMQQVRTILVGLLKWKVILLGAYQLTII